MHKHLQAYESNIRHKTYFQFALLVFSAIGLSKPSNSYGARYDGGRGAKSGECNKIKPTHWLLKRLGHTFDASKVAAAA